MLNLKKLIKLIAESLDQGFNIQKLKRCKTIYDVFNLANDSDLIELGEGSARRAYKLSSKKVLKVARAANGLYQNEFEAETYTKPGNKPILAQIYDYDPDFKWIICELVRPIKIDEITQFTGIKNSNSKKSARWNFEKCFQKMDNSYGQINLNDKQIIEVYSEFIEPGSEQKFLKFFKNVFHFLKNNDTGNAGDISAYDHWGKTGDNRLVLLDYGIDSRGLELFYLNK